MRFIYTKTFTRLFIVFLLVAGFIISDRLGYLGAAKSGFNAGFGGVSNLTARLTNNTKDFFITLATVSSLSRENAELNHRVDELAFENARLAQDKQENIALRRLLNLVDDAAYAGVTAQVEYLDPTGFVRTMAIDKGQNDGIEVNQAVVVAPGILVGKITKVYGSSSEVTLITDPSVSINGEVADSGARGLVHGEHGLSLAFELVTQNEVIKSGDLITTSGLGGDFPSGLLVGEISGLRSSGSELFQRASVAPAAELKKLKFVFVISD